MTDVGPPETERPVDPADSLRVDDRYVPRKRADVLELDMGDGVILYDHSSSLVHHLSPSASLIWQLCDGDADLGSLAAEVSDELGVNAEQARTDLAVLIHELDALGLVEDASAPIRR
jgi:PqqD family protein of HPr-rel-A system